LKITENEHTKKQMKNQKIQQQQSTIWEERETDRCLEREEAGKRRGNREKERGVRVYGWKNNCEEMNGKLVLTSK
jgi:hypothetical protein